jgi:DNA-binding MarR family transcriptional regulator
MSNNDLSSNGDTWVLDPYTGELLQRGSIEPSYLPPLDISSIVSQEVFNEVVKDRKKKWMKLWVSQLVLDIVVERNLTIPALSVLCLLGQKIGYNNMVYTNIKSLAADSGYVRQTVSNSITELKDKGFIREPNNKLNERDSRFFLVNPLYFHLGYYYNRDNIIREWIMGK